MVNEISLKKAQAFRRKSMCKGIQFMQEKVTVGKLADEYARTSDNNSKANMDKSKERQS